MTCPFVADFHFVVVNDLYDLTYRSQSLYTLSVHNDPLMLYLGYGIVDQITVLKQHCRTSTVHFNVNGHRFNLREANVFDQTRQERGSQCKTSNVCMSL